MNTPCADVCRPRHTRIIVENCSRSIALQNMHLLVTDYSHVPEAKHHHVHRSRMATRNWLFSHIRGTHAQNVAVSVLHFPMTLHFGRSVTISPIRPAEIRTVLHSNFNDDDDIYIYIFDLLFIYLDFFSFSFNFIFLMSSKVFSRVL